jgi:dihydrodipicolinate reductase
MRQAQQLSVCIAGATGWTGRVLVRAVLDAPDLALGSASAGRRLVEISVRRSAAKR